MSREHSIVSGWGVYRCVYRCVMGASGHDGGCVLVPKDRADRAALPTRVEIAMNLLEAEFASFVVIARVGDDDPPRADGAREYAIAGRGYDDKLRATAREFSDRKGT